MGGLLRDHVFAGHAVAAGSAVAVASSLTHPLDTLKTLLQVSAGAQRQVSLPRVIEWVKSVSGIAGLYSGLGWSTISRISGMGARFGIYEILAAFYKDGREDNYVYVAEALMAGITAGAVEAIACTPFELLKLRKQLCSASGLKTVRSSTALQEASLNLKLLPGYTPDVKAWSNTLGLLSVLPHKHPDMAGALKQYPWMLTGSGRPPLASEVSAPSSVISLEGWSALWRGLRPGIFRDCVFGGIFFSTWQFIHITMLDWKAVDMNPPPRSLEEVGPVSPLASSLTAGFSGTVAAAASHSFDTAKCRSQATVIPKYIAMERKLLKWRAPGIWLERVTGMSPADRNIMFRGIGLRMASSGITSFAAVGCYFFAVQHLL